MTSESLHPASEELFAYRDGELPSDRRSLVEAHVVGCRSCREQMDEMSRVEAALRARPDEVGDAYYERMQAQVMTKVHAAAPPAPARAEPRPAPLERRRDDEVAEARRTGAPRLPWIAVGSAVSAMAAVVVVVVLLVRHGSMPQMAVLERSAPDAGAPSGARDSITATMQPPPLSSQAAPPADVRAKERQMAEAPAAPKQTVAGDQVAVAPSAGQEKKDQAARNQAREEDLAKLESAPGAMKAAPREQEGAASADQKVALRAEAPTTGALPPAGAPSPQATNRLQSALSRYGLPPVWGPGVSDDLVLQAEPVFRNLYRTGGATTALDSARVRLYLAEAARLRAGASPDSAAIDEIAHHYRRAISLGSSDPATAGTAQRRLREFLSEIGITP